MQNPGDHVLVTHANMLFDLVTCNKYTIDFYKNFLLPSLSSKIEDVENYTDLLRTAYSYAESPPESASVWLGKPEVSKSEREVIDKRRVDPFTYPDQISKLGYDVVEIRPHNCFPLPPMLCQIHPEIEAQRIISHQFINNPTVARICSSGFWLLLRQNDASNPNRRPVRPAEEGHGYLHGREGSPAA
jgi:hypothetical protein